MKLIYLTSQKYPSAKADPFFVKSMALAFAKILARNFMFVVRSATPDELKHLNIISIRLPRHFRTILYFLWMPVVIMFRKWTDHETVFFSSDPYLLSTLVFWRKILGFKYFICSDWHQLFDDWRDNYVAGNSDYLISTSKRLKGMLMSVCGVDPAKILVAYGGVDKDIFDSKSNGTNYRKKLGLPEGEFLVGYIGGFTCLGMDKGITTMIKAINLLDKKIKMVFVGGRKQELEDYKLFAKNEGTEDRCLFIKRQSFGKVMEYEMAMNVLVIPYPDKPHFRNYGFPMKIWEYMASGRPIVYSGLGIMAEVLEDKATSFKPDNASSLAGAIKSILEDIDAAEMVATQNHKEVEDYTWGARARKIISFIDGRTGNTNDNKQTLLSLFDIYVSSYKDQIQYDKSEKFKIKRFFHNARALGLPYILYSLLRLKLPIFVKNIRAKLFFGKKMVLPANDMVANAFAMYGIMNDKSERKLTLWMIKNLGEEEIFYDIGAHFGYYTALSERILKNGEVHSFEANKKTYDYLKRNFSSSNSVFISCVAVTGSEGESDLYSDAKTADSSTVSTIRLSKEYTLLSKTVSITLDKYVNEGNKPPTTIKLDVEGGETEAINGSLDTIKKYKPRIIMEVLKRKEVRGYYSNAIAKLNDLGYEAFSLNSEGVISEKPLDDPIAILISDDSKDNFLFEMKYN